MSSQISRQSGRVQRASVYAAAGFALGALFPIVVWMIDIALAGEPLSLRGIIHLHETNRLHWVLDGAPFVLALLGYQLGRWRQLQMAAAREHMFIETVLDTIDCLVLVLDRAGCVLRLNRAVEKTTGVGEWEARGRPIWEQFLSADDGVRVQAIFDPKLPSELPYRAESAWRTVDGPPRVIAWSAVNAASDATDAHVIVTGIDITERRQLEEQLEHRAFHDSLTELGNRELFRDRVMAALNRTSAEDPSVAVLFLDLDNFKNVNDGLGHAAGDRLLQLAAGRLLNATRGCDVVARLGGDEFGVLLEGVQQQREAVIAAERVARAMRRPFSVNGTEVVVGASIGIAFSSRGQGTDQLMRDADAAMYLAKSGGKGRYALFVPGMQVAAFERLELESDLREAVTHEQLDIHYQPIVRLDTSEIVGVEALARWRHPERGDVAPNEFIPVADETGLIVPLGRWVLRKACITARDWQRAYPANAALTLTVNISARQLRDPDLVDDVRQVLAETGFIANRLVLEITESGLMENVAATLATLHALKALGIALAIDDFGTGYSSLSYLQRFPIDILKIDKAFVDVVGSGTADPVLARTIIFLGGTLRLRTVAEGIEHPRQIEGLRFLGCELGQGHHFSRPLPAPELAVLLARAGGLGAAPAARVGAGVRQ